MPQFNAYPASTEFLAADLLLKWSTAGGAVQSINASDFVAAFQLLWNPNATVAIISGNTVLGDTYDNVVCNSGGALSVTLPLTTASASLLGKKYYITNKGAGTVTINRTGSDTIKGGTTLTMAQYKSYLFISDGAGMWQVFST